MWTKIKLVSPFLTASDRLIFPTNQVECILFFESSFLRSTIGGVLRDFNGCFKCVFSCAIPHMEIDHVEVLAIHRAFKLSISLELLASSSLIVEYDSCNIVAWALL